TLDGLGNIYFSDVSRGGVYRIPISGGKVETVIAKRKGVGGIAMHADGGIVVSGRDVSHVRNGETRILISGPQCPAPGPVMGFNDLCATPEGHILVGPVQLDDGREKLPQNLIRIDRTGHSEIVYSDVAGSNG